MMPELMKGKRGLVMGVANDRSIAWGIAKALHAEGAELAFSYQGEAFGKRVLPLAESLGSDIMVDVDVTDDESLDAAFGKLKNEWGTLDFVVHAIAYSDKNELAGRFINTTRDNFKNSLTISCYSLIDVARRAAPLMAEGGSIITLTYQGSNRVTPFYNVMGVAKAALESTVRYLANDLGPQGIRVNAISPGPMKTLAGAAIGGGHSGSGGTVDISDNATVRATSVDVGAAIGSGGYSDNSGTINISGGTVTARNTRVGGAGIGGGMQSRGHSITISGGEVTAYSGTGGAGIGGGAGGGAINDGTIRISGGTIVADASEGYDFWMELPGGAGIGGGYGKAADSIIITGGTIQAKGYLGSAGIGGGEDSGGGNITISGGAVVTANGYYYGAGIGGGKNGHGGNITISGGTVSARGGSLAAAIGGGQNGDGGVITLSGGTIEALGGSRGAGIGGGDGGRANTISISNSHVTADGGRSAAAIGGGRGGTGGAITISSGTTIANGGDNSAGIGGGDDGSAGDIRVSGGTVFAGMGSGGTYDIGYGEGYTPGAGEEAVLHLENEPMVFLRNDASIDVAPASYAHFPYQGKSGGKVYGITVPDAWSGAGVYALGSQIVYDDNGGQGGTAYNLPKGSIATALDSGVSKAGYTFSEWNTQASGGGTGYSAGASIPMDAPLITLYAIWNHSYRSGSE